MVRKSFRVMVCLDLHQVSCPGVWLCPKGKIFITLSLFKCLETTKQIKPFFPLKYHQRFVFDKIFDSLSSLGELENEMGTRNIRMELVQVFKGKQKLVTLGVFQAPLTNVLYPAVAPGSDSGAAEVDLLFEACKPFPGIIAPKAEVSTRVVIEELRLCPKFTDGPVNPTLVSSAIKCGMAKSRQSSVCHQKDNKNCKCNCCCSSGRIILRRPSTSGNNHSPMSKSIRCSTIPLQDIIEGGDDNNSESNGEQYDDYNKTTDNRTNYGDCDQNNIYDRTNYQDNLQRKDEEEHVVRNHYQQDGTDDDQFHRRYQNDIQNNDNQQQRDDNIRQYPYDNRQQREYDNQKQTNDNQIKSIYDNSSKIKCDNRQHQNQNGKQNKNQLYGRNPIQNINDRVKPRSSGQYYRGENNGSNSAALNRNSMDSQSSIQKQKVRVDVHVDAVDDLNDQIEPRYSREVSEQRCGENQQRSSEQSPYEMNQRPVTRQDQELQINRSADNTKNTCDCGIQCTTCKKTMENLMVPWKVYAAPPFYNHYCNHGQNMMDNPQHQNSRNHQNQPNMENQNGSSFSNNHHQNFTNNDNIENNQKRNINNYNGNSNNQQRFQNQRNSNGSHHQNLNNDIQNIHQNNDNFHQIPPPRQSTTTQTSAICRCQEKEKFSANVEKQNEQLVHNKTPFRLNTQIKDGNMQKNPKSIKPSLNQQQLRNNQQNKVQNRMINRQTNPIINEANNQCPDQQTNLKEDREQYQVMEVRFICPCGHIESSLIPQNEDRNRGSIQYRNIQTNSVGIPTRNNQNKFTNKYYRTSGIPTLNKPNSINRTSKLAKVNEEEVIKHYPKNYLTCICPKPKSLRLRKEC